MDKNVKISSKQELVSELEISEQSLERLIEKSKLTLGNNIKKYRKEKNITQKDLGLAINRKEITIRKYESGDISPNIETLSRIALALGITINELIGLSDEYSRATSLSNTYFNAIMKWSEDGIFSNIQTVCIREHFWDLLLRYKGLINSLSNSMYTWRKEKESFTNIYKNREEPLSDAEIKELFLKQELEREIIDLVNWVKAFPNWMARREVELSTESNDKTKE